MIYDIKEKLLEQHGIDSFQRIAPTHPLPFYIGIDTVARYALFCIVETAPTVNIISSSIISAFIGQRRDGTYGITFSLADTDYFDQFVYFCSDLIETTAGLKDNSKAADKICARYLQWQKAFAKSGNGLLSVSEIRGLIGELCFLQSELIPKIGEANALGSWCGPEMADRDFECPDTWYEVKATVSGAESVKISSIEQLDTPQKGHLVVVFLDKTSLQDPTRITLNSIFHSIYNSLSSDLLKEKFKTILLSFGYYEQPGYNNYCYKYMGMEFYSVDSSFPCIRKQDIPSSAHDVKYDLSLSAIAMCKEN